MHFLKYPWRSWLPLSLLVEYRTRSPHRWPVDGEFFKGESLGAWCHAQQYNYWKDSLSDSRHSSETERT